jgi:hypothetical protein
LVKDFFAGNPSYSFSAETIVVGRLYVGYGEMPPAPDPNSNQYYGWVEFSRNNVDKGVYLNLSNVDIVGLPLTLKGKLADDGKPFSLGYKKPVPDIVAEMKTRALTRQDPGVVIDCGSGRTKIVAPNIQFPFYRVRRLSEHIDDGGRQTNDSNRYAERRNVQDVHGKLFHGQVPGLGQYGRYHHHQVWF